MLKNSALVLKNQYLGTNPDSQKQNNLIISNSYINSERYIKFLTTSGVALNSHNQRAILLELNLFNLLYS